MSHLLAFVKGSGWYNVERLNTSHDETDALSMTIVYSRQISLGCQAQSKNQFSIQTHTLSIFLSLALSKTPSPPAGKKKHPDLNVTPFISWGKAPRD